MPLKLGDGREHLFAVSAKESLASVNAHVGVERRLVRERLVAMLATERPLTGVNDQMGDQMLILLEGARALITFKWPFPYTMPLSNHFLLSVILSRVETITCVGSHVLLQRRTVSESLVAVRLFAFQRFAAQMDALQTNSKLY